MVKKKKHDKDKYYNLAKQQGYRARSAFKLIQLNKKYDFLSNAKVCIDLCAAPGGWCQVAAKYMPTSSIILGIDLLPIRPIPRVKTLVCDITTQKCRSWIKQELQTWSADIVLCDGAPNVGAEYSKDAYVQNELALIAMKLAVEVLGRGGTFVTKVFRSADYNALLWVFKQLFKKVSATKPLSSRNESAEIFVVCEDFIAPGSIDPKLTDPKFVFTQVDMAEPALTIFHPKYGVRKRHRQGYDESMPVTMRHEASVEAFVECTDPIRFLTDTSAIEVRSSQDMAYMALEVTTTELKTCIADLKVLGKGDFKKILKWRVKLIAHKAAEAEVEALAAAEGQADEMVEPEPVVALTLEEQEAQTNTSIREELAQARAVLQAKKKREKKKDREAKAKLRVRQALGMESAGMTIEADQDMFNLTSLGLSKDKVDDVMDAGDCQVVEESMPMPDSGDSGSDVGDSDEDENAAYDRLMDETMDVMYNQFMSKKDSHKLTKRAVKRTKIAKRALAGDALVRDAELYDGNASAYQSMLNPASDDEEEEAETQPVGSLVVKPTLQESDSTVANRWFTGHPLFAQVDEAAGGNAEAEASDVVKADTSVRAKVAMLSDDSDSEAGDVTHRDMPLTDKQLRHAKRKATRERNERRDLKKMKRYDMTDDDLLCTKNQIIEQVKSSAMSSDEEGEKEADAARVADMTFAEARKVDQTRALIKAGLGRTAKTDTTASSTSFDIVKTDDEGPNKDTRVYDSDDFDDEDRIKELALGTMMLRRSKAKAIIDASYNRYAWNDPAELPDWFADDEEKNYRPQVEIPRELIDQMREKFMSMATKPVKKVAEARARKKRQNTMKLKVAKKKATDIANLPDMSTQEKVKSISKAMQGAEIKKPSKVYVVSTRGGRKSAGEKQKSGKGGGKVKFVDARMKNDMRNTKRKKRMGKK